MDLMVFQQLGMSVLLGGLVGLERERRSGDKGFGGLRTFTLISFLGALSYMLGRESLMIFGILTAGFLVLLFISYWFSADRFHGITSEIASILIYIVGVFCARGEFVLATVITLVVLFVLYFKEKLHLMAKQIDRKEIFSTVQFVIIAFIVLPLLPNPEVGYGPFGFFNPHEVWLMVVFISGLSFASYVAMKIIGASKGYALAGFLAGFTSTTALTLSLGAQSRENKKIVNPYVIALIIAISAMFVRVIVEVSAKSPVIADMILVPMLVLLVAGFLLVLGIWKFGKRVSRKIQMQALEIRSPFSFGEALKFAVAFSVIIFFVKMADSYFGDRGVYALSAISGLFDIDAIVLQISDMANNGLAQSAAAVAIIIATISNAFSKVLILVLLGSRHLAWRLFLACCVFLFTAVLYIFFVLGL